MKRILYCSLAVFWLWVGGVPLAAQCTGGRCPMAVPDAAVVRVANLAPDGARYYGSGTLIEKDARRGIVLTSAHLFRPAAGNVVITFSDGRAFSARLLAADRVWDLAALAIAVPEATPAKIATDYPRPGDRLRSCGYGPDGRYWCNRGRALGYARPAAASTHETLQLSGCARQGDSGGPVFNERGELVAVVWGTDGRTVGGTYCGRIRRFLARILSLGCLPPECPAPPAPTPAPPAPDQPGPSAEGDGLEVIRGRLESLADRLAGTEQEQGRQRQSWDARIEKIEKAVALVASLKGRIEKAEAVVGTENLRAVVRKVARGVIADRGPQVAQAVLSALLAALGWTGPPSIAAVLAIRLLAGILRRRVAQRLESGGSAGLTMDRGSPLPTNQPPLNDDYAEQLARVYALSGHSPIADATLGREYDQELRQAEQASDSTLATWARKLRQRVAERFYRIHGRSPMPAEPAEKS